MQGRLSPKKYTKRKGTAVSMESVFWIGMSGMLDGAMVCLIGRLLRCGETEKKPYRFLSGSFAVGFLLGLIAAYLADSPVAVWAPVALGGMLAYTAFLFTFPEKGSRHEGS